MPKTKKVASKKIVRNVKPATAVSTTKHEVCGSTCLLCWLFKVMIAMFAVMIVFWLGFCFGALSAPTTVKNVAPLMSTTLPSGNFCAASLLNSSDAVVQGMNTTLLNKTGDDFDKEYLLQSILEHQGVIEMAKKVLTQSSREDLKKYAQGIIDAQTKDITQLQAWQDAWFNTTK